MGYARTTPAMPVVDTPASRATDPETSHIAEANHKASGKCALHRQMIADAVARTPGMTGAQIAVATGIDYIEVMRRISEVCTAERAMEGPAVHCTIRQTRCSTWYPHPSAKSQ